MWTKLKFHLEMLDCMETKSRSWPLQLSVTMEEGDLGFHPSLFRTCWIPPGVVGAYPSSCWAKAVFILEDTQSFTFTPKRCPECKLQWICLSMEGFLLDLKLPVYLLILDIFKIKSANSFHYSFIVETVTISEKPASEETTEAPRSWRETTHSARQAPPPSTSPRRSSRCWWWCHRGQRWSLCHPLWRTGEKLLINKILLLFLIRDALQLHFHSISSFSNFKKNVLH